MLGIHLVDRQPDFNHLRTIDLLKSESIHFVSLKVNLCHFDKS